MSLRWLKHRSVVAVLLVALLVLSACTGGGGNSGSENATGDPPEATSTDTPAAEDTGTATDEPEPQPEPEKHDPVELTIHGWFFSPALKATIAAFMEEYPWITVTENTSINQAVINNIIAGEKSDLVILDRGLSEWVTNGNDLLEDLTPYLDKDERIQNSNLVEGLLESFSTGGKTYALPWTDIPMWIAVNKELLSKYGMEMPGSDWTYDDLLEMAKKATNKDANDWGMFGLAGDMNDIRAIANGSAGSARLLSADRTKSVADSPEVLADLQWSQDLIRKWNVQPNPEQIKENGFAGDPAVNFVNGNFLFITGVDWILPTLQQATFDWDVLPFPRGSQRQVTLHQVGPMSMVKASEHKEEAFMFLSFLFSEKAQKLSIDNGSGSWVKSPEIDAYYDQAAIWKGKNIENVKMSAQMCCYWNDMNVMDLGDYVNSVSARIGKMMNEGGNFSEVIPFVEEYNKKAAETRKALGW
ncbi:ABC transporter substrate-binding protein [Paenibacillus thermotolerans]|uniref:ABC transporter substrate-binding protein n=1 Tax=Paenibacillus thermotolerans TaxID=3027807 RepID=UPI002367A3D0|nr:MULTISPECIES: extracellular solute-binding protein [unclassified Paenibacillus]